MRIQRAVKTGAKDEVIFGRNEGPGQRFHGWVDALIEADGEQAVALLSHADEFHDREARLSLMRRYPVAFNQDRSRLSISAGL